MPYLKRKTPKDLISKDFALYKKIDIDKIRAKQNVDILLKILNGNDDDNRVLAA